MSEVLVLYYSRYGATASLANEIAHGVDSVAGAAARVRTVPAVSPDTRPTLDAVPDSGPPYVTRADLAECDALCLGSPTRFGNMSAALKYFIDSTGDDWLKGTLVDKPAAVFTSTSTMHGGNESTLLTMALPLLHHGMLLVGLPFTDEDLANTRTGGTPYGASHVTFNRESDRLSDEEARLARALGRRVATVARRLSGN